MRLLRAIFGRLLAFWRPSVGAGVAVVVEPAVHAIGVEEHEVIQVEVPSQSAAVTAVESADVRDHKGKIAFQWEFRAGILDRLDEYFDCLRRLRAVDPESCELLGRVGFNVPADAYANPDAAVYDAVTGDGAAFGGILFGQSGDTLDKERIYPSFIYFQKLKSPPGVEYSRWTVYELTAMFDNRQRGRDNLSVPCRCHLALTPEGHLTLLREFTQTSHKIETHRSRRGTRRKGSVTFTKNDWNFPAWLTDEEVLHGRTPEEVATHFFKTAYFTNIGCQEKIVVRVRHGRNVAAFGIEVARSKYFFKDRDASALAADGKRKRIFHAVVAHGRALGDGRSTEVRAHYRGLRHFDWNGYQVAIVRPSSVRLTDFTAAAEVIDSPAEANVPGFCSNAEAGKRLDETLSA